MLLQVLTSGPEMSGLLAYPLTYFGSKREKLCLHLLSGIVAGTEYFARCISEAQEPILSLRPKKEFLREYQRSISMMYKHNIIY